MTPKNTDFLKTLCLIYAMVASNMGNASMNATNNVKSDVGTTNLTVNVHDLGNAGSMESISDAKGRVIAEVYKDKNGRVVKNVECTYNTNDCPVKVVCKDAQGRIRYVGERTYDENKVCIQETETIGSSIITKKYDKQGCCIAEIYENNDKTTETQHTYGQDGKRNSTVSTEYVNGKIETISNYTFDQKGRLQSVITKDPSGKVINIYEQVHDVKDRCVFESNKDLSGNGEETFKYAYDQNDRLIKKTRSIFHDGKLCESFEHFLDQNGDTVKVVLKDGNGKVLNSEEKVYNTNRRVLKMINKDGNGKIEDTIEYTYTQTGDIKTMVHKDSKGQELNSSEYIYAQDGKAIEIEKNIDGSVIRYAYDTDGRRTKEVLRQPIKKISGKKIKEIQRQKLINVHSQ